MSSGVLVVTGGSRGIGGGICRLAAERGWVVCVNYASAAGEAAKVVSDIESKGGRAIAVQADVSDEDSVERMFEKADEELGPVTGLVNNAGIMGSRGRVEELNAELTWRMFKVNILGPLICSKAAIKRMSEKNGGKGGAIVNISSASSRHGGAGSYVDFATSKGAVDAMNNGLAREVAAESIRVNCVRPGLIMTEGNQQWEGDHPGWAASVTARTPMGRAGELQDTATATLWLLSDEAQYVTGAILDVSGGFVTP
ncbi:MAG: SDR family oxidoreductase [Arenicellales bacterium]|nr:SDR family oxidoreductase [Arenicellales bacterium]